MLTLILLTNFAAKTFDVAKRLQTHSSLLSRNFNRPKLDDLKKMDLSQMLDEKNGEVLPYL